MSCACAIDCKCLPVPVRPLPSFASRSLICQKSNGAKCEVHRPMGIVHLYALASARRPYCEKHCSTGSGGSGTPSAEGGREAVQTPIQSARCRSSAVQRKNSLCRVLVPLAEAARGEGQGECETHRICRHRRACGQPRRCMP